MDVVKTKKNYEMVYSAVKGEIDIFTGKPFEEIMPTPQEFADNLNTLITNIAIRTACNSCPKKGTCNRINWDADLALVEVTGCDLHPDQAKYKGHSTTIVITAMVADEWSNGQPFWDWNTERTDTGTNTTEFWMVWGFYSINGVANFIYRGEFRFDTTIIPLGQYIYDARLQLWMGYKNLTVHPTGIIQKTIPAVPHYPYNAGWNTDYDISNFSGNYGSVNNSALILNQYNDVVITNRSLVQVGGYTIGAIRWIDDINDIDPGAYLGNNANNAGGTASPHPLKLQVTYGNPPPPPSPVRAVVVGVTGDPVE